MAEFEDHRIGQTIRHIETEISHRWHHTRNNLCQQMLNSLSNCFDEIRDYITLQKKNGNPRVERIAELYIICKIVNEVFSIHDM